MSCIREEGLGGFEEGDWVGVLPLLFGEREEGKWGRGGKRSEISERRGDGMRGGDRGIDGTDCFVWPD